MADIVKPRACFYKTAPAGLWLGGKWHAWTVFSEPTADWALHVPAAIVEDDKTGEIRAVPCEWVRFLTPS